MPTTGRWGPTRRGASLGEALSQSPPGPLCGACLADSRLLRAGSSSQTYQESVNDGADAGAEVRQAMANRVKRHLGRVGWVGMVWPPDTSEFYALTGP